MKKVPKKANQRGASTNSISMHELNRNLSLSLKGALKEPLRVTRYESPYVCILAQEVLDMINTLRKLIPRDHILVTLRTEIDSRFINKGLELRALSERCVSGMDAAFVVRAWALQQMYFIDDPKHLYEAMIYNNLWRWFIGFEYAWTPVPALELFEQDLAMISAEPDVIRFVNCILNDNPLMETSRESRRLNGLLENLRVKDDGAGITDMKEITETKVCSGMWDSRSQTLSNLSGMYAGDFVNIRSNNLISLESVNLIPYPNIGSAKVVDIMSKKKT